VNLTQIGTKPNSDFVSLIMQDAYNEDPGAGKQAKAIYDYQAG
jgi:hypothetical protein